MNTTFRVLSPTTQHLSKLRTSLTPTVCSEAPKVGQTLSRFVHEPDWFYFMVITGYDLLGAALVGDDHFKLSLPIEVCNVTLLK